MGTAVKSVNPLKSAIMPTAPIVIRIAAVPGRESAVAADQARYWCRNTADLVQRGNNADTEGGRGRIKAVVADADNHADDSAEESKYERCNPHITRLRTLFA
jgi:hypothetical protein